MRYTTQGKRSEALKTKQAAGGRGESKKAELTGLHPQPSTAKTSSARAVILSRNIAEARCALCTVHMIRRSASASALQVVTIRGGAGACRSQYRVM